MFIRLMLKRLNYNEGEFHSLDINWVYNQPDDTLSFHV
jgi:hypothetical protein